MFATFDPAALGSNQTLSYGNLTTTLSTNTFYSNTLATNGHSSGKYYYEVTINNVNLDGQAIGIANTSYGTNPTDPLGTDAGENSVGWVGGNATARIGNGPIGTAVTWTNSDVLDIAVDIGAQLIWFRKNGGSWNNNGSADPATGVGGFSLATLSAGPYFPAVGLEIGGDQYTANFGASAYAHSAPAGFGNWGVVDDKPPYNPWPQMMPILAQ